jgi:hypothetical protein
MVAVAIVATALILITQGFSTSLRAVQTSREYLVASFMAEDQLALLEEEWMTKADEKILNRRGHFLFSDRRFSWMIDSTPVRDLPLIKVHFGVTWDGHRRTEGLSMDTFFLEPLRVRRGFP